jgi:(p)ppGpp synthase/HD superfamily hydrolase
MTAMLQSAERQARQAHAGQLEELTGDDYIHHVERVVALVEGDEAKAVAWLHDVLEDTTVSADDLLAAGVSETVVEAVRLLTKPKADPHVSPEQKHRSYQDYINTLLDGGNALALAVKMADLRDHLRPMDREVLTASMRQRYETALRTLQGDAR